MKPVWTPEEIQILRDNYHLMPTKDLISLIPLHAKTAIHKKAEKIGLRGYIKAEWSPAEIKTLIELYPTYEVNELTKILNRTKLSIKKKVLTLDLKKRTVWSQSDENILKSIYKEKPVKDILSENIFPDKDYWSITSHAKYIGLKKDPSVFRRKHTYNRRFFKTINNATCYIAGFIAADGSLSNDRNTVCIKIQKQDKFLLEHFAKEVGFTDTVKEYNKKEWTEGSYVSLYLASAQEMVKDLKDNFNLTPKKMYTLEPPQNLSLEQTLAFLVGFLDGDGCISFSSDKKYLIIGFSGTQKMMEWVKSIFDSLVLPTTSSGPAKVSPIKGSRAFGYKVGGLRAYKLLKIMQAIDTPIRLDRKWNKIEEYEQIRAQAV